MRNSIGGCARRLGVDSRPTSTHSIHTKHRACDLGQVLRPESPRRTARRLSASRVRFTLVLLLSPSALKLPRRCPRRPRAPPELPRFSGAAPNTRRHRTQISPSSATPMGDLTSRPVRAPRTTRTGRTPREPDLKNPHRIGPIRRAEHPEHFRVPNPRESPFGNALDPACGFRRTLDRALCASH